MKPVTSVPHEIVDAEFNKNDVVAPLLASFVIANDPSAIVLPFATQAKDPELTPKTYPLLATEYISDYKTADPSAYGIEDEL